MNRIVRTLLAVFILITLVGCRLQTSSLHTILLGVTPTAILENPSTAGQSPQATKPATTMAVSVSPEHLTDEQIEDLYDAAEALTIQVYEKVSPSVVFKMFALC